MTVRVREQSGATNEQPPPPDPAALLEQAVALVARLHQVATRVTELGNQHRRLASELLLFGDQLHEFAADVQELADHQETTGPVSVDAPESGKGSHDTP
ncbi:MULTISPECIES: hypothetical protein [Amycolatopsis]|uniref:Uncharacterized protein n=2 Tax=Amycolatopsis TaxID=1813 RepID=A0A1I4A9D8_9PSEU|nr:hypothetical protein [Amycolatopsis sacchari]SFK53005.1 hypothetical protein SAMN05421835_12382 [Amycolatopsis sacchari]